MATIELSNIVIEGLKSLNSVDLSKKLITNAVKMSLYSESNIPANPEIYATNADLAKQAEYAVLTLLFLAIKHDFDNQKLRSLLMKHEVSPVVIEDLINAYDRNKSQLRIKNITTGLSLPHITNVEWKLTCDVKSSHVDGDSGGLLYRINLGRYKEVSGERESITEFVCNVEELQLLINRLKDIERHCEKVVNGK